MSIGKLPDWKTHSILQDGHKKTWIRGSSRDTHALQDFSLKLHYRLEWHTLFSGRNQKRSKMGWAGSKFGMPTCK